MVCLLCPSVKLCGFTHPAAPPADRRWSGYTKRDIGIWSEVMARTLTAAGINRQSFIQIAYGYGLFTGGLGVHYGAELVGASVYPRFPAAIPPVRLC